MKISKNESLIYILLLAAFFLRLPGVFDGLPAVYNSTEYLLAKTALNLGAQQTLDPGIYIYPTFYTYLLFLIYGLYFILSYPFGVFENTYDFAIKFLIDPSIFYILPRLVNVIIGLFTVLILYHMLRKSANEQIARYAAFLMLLSSYLTEYSMVATADTLLVLFSTLATAYFYLLFRNPALKNFLICGLFAGLATAAKYNAGFLVAGLFLTVFIVWKQRQVPFIKTALISLAGVFAGFFIMNPLWLIYPKRFFEGLHLVSAQMFTAISSERGLPYIWELITLIQDELIIGILFILATTYYLFNAETKHVPGLAVIGLTFLFVGAWTKKGVDYLFAVYPAWIILSGYFISKYLHPHIATKSTRIFIYLLIIVPSLSQISLNAIRYLNQDTREQATEWLINNTNKKMTICYDNSHFDLGSYDINRFLDYGEGAGKLPEPVKMRLSDYKDGERQINVMPVLVENHSCTLKTDNPYESESTRFRRRSLPELVNLGVDYLICNRQFYDGYLTANLHRYAPGIQIGIMEVQQFYEKLFKNYQPAKIFHANFWHRGPEIQIYKLNQTGRK